MKLQFLMCGEANDAFFSQAAMFRLMLDTHGGFYANAQMTLCLGSTDAALPDPWRAPLARIDLRFLADGRAADEDDLAQSMLTYESISPDADIAIICDADTLLIRPYPEAFLSEMKQSPALAGCIAHFAPQMKDSRKPPPPDTPATDGELWERLSGRLLGSPVPMPYRYSLRRAGEPPPQRCPFYINLGVFIGTPDLFARFHAEHMRCIPVIREVLENRFYEQISVPFAAQRSGVPVRELPMRFNFPNDPLAEMAYPDEAAAIVQLHYMRTKAFNRHRIFAGPEDFAAFMDMPLAGSNAMLQSAVRSVTGGRYPF